MAFNRPREAAREDLRLMERISSGDPAALAELYDQHSSWAFAFCLRALRNRSDAEEVLQEVFWEMWTHRERYDPRQGSPLGYLVTLTRSRAIDRLRLRERRRDLVARATGELMDPGPGPGVDPLESVLAGEARGQLRKALDLLPTDYRRPVVMAYFDGLSHAEIAEALGEPIGTVKTRIRRGLLRLRDALYGAGAPGGKT